MTKTIRETLKGIRDAADDIYRERRTDPELNVNGNAKKDAYFIRLWADELLERLPDEQTSRLELLEAFVRSAAHIWEQGLTSYEYDDNPAAWDKMDAAWEALRKSENGQKAEWTLEDSEAVLAENRGDAQ